MKVSIIVSSHNYVSYVGAAVESALGQDHPDLEVLVVDDGSTDGSRDLLRGYADCADLIHTENGGQASAMNAGFARADGEVVIFLDADDLLRHDAASRAATAFGEHPGAVRAQFRMAVINADGHFTGETRPRAHLPMRSGDLRRAELASPFDLAWVPTSGNAFRADALRRIFPIPTGEYRLGADVYLVHLTTLLGDVVSLEEVGAYYRVHGGNGHERDERRLDMDHLRRNIAWQQATIYALSRLADELGMDRPKRILSMANTMSRLISWRLAPGLHPVAKERRGALVLETIRAAERRFDVSVPLKAVLVAWCAAIAIAPRPVVVKLAEMLVFPGRRPGLARLSGRLHRGDLDART